MEKYPSQAGKRTGVCGFPDPTKSPAGRQAGFLPGSLTGFGIDMNVFTVTGEDPNFQGLAQVEGGLLNADQDQGPHTTGGRDHQALGGNPFDGSHQRLDLQMDMGGLFHLNKLDLGGRRHIQAEAGVTRKLHLRGGSQDGKGWAP